MEFLAMLYTVLLVAICLMMALLLFRSGRPTGGLDEADCEELKDWLEEQLAAQAREFNARQDADRPAELRRHPQRQRDAADGCAEHEHHPRSGAGQPAAHPGAASAEPRAGQQPADGAAAPRHGREHDGIPG